MTNISCHYAEQRPEERELPKCGKTYGYPPSMRHGSATHTHMAYDVSLLPQKCNKWLRQKMDVNCNVKVFTQKAAVSHEASGLQHSHLTGSFSQTRSEEETVKYTVHMTSSCPSTEHTDSIFRLGGSVVLLLAQFSRCFIQEGPKSLLCLISLLISQRIFFGLNHERKLKSSSKALCYADELQINGFCRC